MRTIALGVVPLTATAIAARLGPVALGGQQIAMRVWYLLALLLDALAVPAQVYVSSALGAADAGAARRVGRRTLRLGLVAGIAAYIPVAALVLRFHRLGLPGVWAARWLWLAARAALLGRRWQAQFSRPA